MREKGNKTNDIKISRALARLSKSSGGEFYPHFCLRPIGALRPLQRALSRQLPSHVDSFGHVEPEKVCRGFAGRCEASDFRVDEFKVFLPALRPRIEKHLDSARFRINRCHIRTFVPVAVWTRQGKIRGLLRTAMLPRGNVFDVEANSGHYRLRQTTVLTCVEGAVTNKLPDRCVHGLLPVVRLED